MTTSPVMRLLGDGVPITLLLDLTDPGGPDSVAINAAERPASDPLWLDAADPEQPGVLVAGRDTA